MLTKEQEAAVQHVYGPMMVVAGPGSGKTMVLTQRVKYLLAYTQPERILVITFAKKAAEEMKKRFAAITNEHMANKVTFGTFHAVFYHWLRNWGVVPSDVQVMEEEQKEKLWLELGWDMEDVPAFLLCHRDEFMKYQEEKRKRKWIDFDDMMQLMEREIVRHDVSQEYEFFLIDEFQDINPQQYQIVKHMVGKGNANLFIVGDEDQAIYAFRGSAPELFLGFPDDFPNCRRIDLTVNFRSQQRIVTAAGELIQHNQARFDKVIRADKEKGEPVRVRSTFDDKQEARYIRDQIIKHRYQGYRYNEMAILCRTNAQLKKIASALQEGGVPFECNESWEIGDKPEELLIRQDLELFWRLCRDTTDREAFQRVLRVLPVLQKAGNWRRVEEGKSVFEGILGQKMDAEVRRETEEFWKKLRAGAKMTREKAFRYWLLQTDYLSYAYDKAKRRGLSKMAVWRQIWLMFAQKDREKVSLLTMHGAKGLEFDWVWICGMNEGEMPRKEALEARTIEEERRLLYVAMTRARRRLTLSYYDGLGAKPSSFLKEIKSLQSFL